MEKNDRALAIARLLDLADEVAKAARLVRKSRVPGEGGIFPNTLLELAVEEFKSRRLRADIFGSDDLSAEPGWDILLDLYISQADGTKLLSSKVGALSGIPVSTATRWVKVLEGRGLVMTENDLNNRRRSSKVLTERGRSRIEAYLLARLNLRQKADSKH